VCFHRHLRGAVGISSPGWSALQTGLWDTGHLPDCSERAVLGLSEVLSAAAMWPWNVVVAYNLDIRVP
jgi:hypothetical protein